MCPHTTGDNPPSEMIEVPLSTNGTHPATTNGKRGTTSNGMRHYLEQRRKNPYAPRAADFLSNISNFNIIESTLRGLSVSPFSLFFLGSFIICTAFTEGEQFANAFFDTDTKISIAKALDAFGVEYIELTSPAASEQSRLDCEAICKLGLKSKILTHIRCHMDDARIAVETGTCPSPFLIMISLAPVLRCRWCRCCHRHFFLPP
jgi:homocitrate synthase